MVTSSGGQHITHYPVGGPPTITIVTIVLAMLETLPMLHLPRAHSTLGSE